MGDKVETGNSSSQNSIQGNNPEYKSIRIKKTIKTKIFNQLLEVGTDYDSFMGAFRMYNPKAIEGILNTSAAKAQNIVEQESRHLDGYHKIANLLNSPNENESESQMKNEIPLALEAIANLEPHLNPRNCDNIDFADVYHNLSKLMKGEPIPKVDAISQHLLHEAYNEVINEIEGKQGKEDLQRLQEFLLTGRYDNFTEENAMQLKEIFNDITFNPLKLPLEFLIKNPIP